MKKKIFILLTPLLSVNTFFILLNGCHHCSPPSSCAYYNRAELLALDNADSTSHSPSAAGVTAKAFLLVLSLNDTTYSCMKEPDAFNVPSAYAECLNNIRYTSVDSVSITSNHDFDATHPAGADLKDVFKIQDTISVHTGRNDFYMLRSPADTGTHTFTIKLFLQDTTKNISATSMPVKLLL